MALVDTVDNNRSGYTRQSYMKAQLAHKINIIIGRPSTKDYKLYLEKNDIVDCPISFAGVNAAGDIFGKDEGSSQGNTV